jgi:hypothetical protein
VPMAEAAEGRNVFVVRGKLLPGAGATSGPQAQWQVAGVEGLAKIDTERMSLLEIGARRIVDTIRLWVW